MSTVQKQKNTSFFGRTLQYVKPFVSFLPQIKSPVRNPSIREKFVWTVIAVLIYLLASQAPLFGIIGSDSKDPLAWMRMMMASNRGTLMDLGISPVVTSSMIMQFITGIGLIQPNFAIKEDKILVNALQKLIAIVMTFGQAVIQISSGYYGIPKNIGYCYCGILFIQLMISGLIVILLDELLQKGYGFGNGVNLFIVVNVCERIIWNAFSPRAYFTGRGLEFEGCLISTVHLLLSRKNKLAALYEIFFRQNLPNMYSFCFTVAVFCLVVYLQSLRVEIPIVSNKHKGLVSAYPIKLLYASTTPVMIQSHIILYISSFSRFAYNIYPKNLFVRMLGTWDYDAMRGFIPTSGFCCYIFPPYSFTDAISRPIFTIAYLTIVLLTAGLLSKGWLESHDEDSASVFKRIKAQDMQLKGVRDGAAVSKLDEYVPVAAFLGGVITAFVIVICDVASTMGSGNNIFLAASIINQYMKLAAKETAKRSVKILPLMPMPFDDDNDRESETTNMPCVLSNASEDVQPSPSAPGIYKNGSSFSKSTSYLDFLDDDDIPFIPKPVDALEESVVSAPASTNLNALFDTSESDDGHLTAPRYNNEADRQDGTNSLPLNDSMYQISKPAANLDPLDIKNGCENEGDIQEIVNSNNTVNSEYFYSEPAIKEGNINNYKTHDDFTAVPALHNHIENTKDLEKQNTISIPDYSIKDKTITSSALKVSPNTLNKSTTAMFSTPCLDSGVVLNYTPLIISTGNRIIQYKRSQSKRYVNGALIDKELNMFEFKNVHIPEISNVKIKNILISKVMEMDINTKTDIRDIEKCLGIQRKCLFKNDLIIKQERIETFLKSGCSKVKEFLNVFDNLDEFGYFCILAKFNELGCDTDKEINTNKRLLHSNDGAARNSNLIIDPSYLHIVTSLNNPHLTRKFITSQPNFMVYFIIFYRLGLVTIMDYAAYFYNNLYYVSCLQNISKGEDLSLLLYDTPTITQRGGWSFKNVLDFGISKLMSVEESTAEQEPDDLFDTVAHLKGDKNIDSCVVYNPNNEFVDNLQNKGVLEVENGSLTEKLRKIDIRENDRVADQISSVTGNLKSIFEDEDDVDLFGDNGDLYKPENSNSSHKIEADAGSRVEANTSCDLGVNNVKLENDANKYNGPDYYASTDNKLSNTASADIIETCNAKPVNRLDDIEPVNRIDANIETKSNENSSLKNTESSYQRVSNLMDSENIAKSESIKTAPVNITKDPIYGISKDTESSSGLSNVENPSIYKKKFSKSFADIFSLGGGSSNKELDVGSFVDDVNENDKPMLIREYEEESKPSIFNVFGMFKRKSRPEETQNNQPIPPRPRRIAMKIPERVQERKIISGVYANKKAAQIEIPGAAIPSVKRHVLEPYRTKRSPQMDTIESLEHDDNEQ